MVTNSSAFVCLWISTFKYKQNWFIKFHLLGMDFEVHQNRFTPAVIPCFCRTVRTHQKLMWLSLTSHTDRFSVVRNRLLKFAANLQGSQEGQKLGANFSKFAPIGISVAAELSELSRVDKLDQTRSAEFWRLASSIVKAYVNLSSQWNASSHIIFPQ